MELVHDFGLRKYEYISAQKTGRTQRPFLFLKECFIP